MSINTTGGHSGGLIGGLRCKYNTIKDCYAEAYINAAGHAHGGLIGTITPQNETSTIETSYSKGKITGKGANRGGLIGGLYNGTGSKTIENCYSNVDIEFSGENIGGFIGIIDADKAPIIQITNCYSTGDITFSGTASEITNSRFNGGFIGLIKGNNTSTISTIENCYSTGNIKGAQYFGGFLGSCLGRTTTVKNCYSTGDISYTNGTNPTAGGLCGYKGNTAQLTIENSYSLSVKAEKLTGLLVGYNNIANTLTINNSGYSNEIAATGKPVAGGSSNASKLTNIGIYEGKTPFKLGVIEFGLQVGINGNENSRLSVETSFSLDGICKLYDLDIGSEEAFGIIDELLNRVYAKYTEMGTAQNRLESVMEEISIQNENLASTRSTIRDADIGKVSAQYIKQQILQQASATLLATANQTPALALRLLGVGN